MLNPEAKQGEHQLQTRWTLWYDEPNQITTTYGEHIKEIYSFSTVENFWKLYNTIIKASKLKPSSSYYLFRKGIEPKWEDQENQNGGRWIHYCQLSPQNKQYNQNEINEEEREKIEEKWINTMLACIGEDFPMSECIKGCIFNSKKNQMRISLWINCSNGNDIKKAQKLNKLIGQKFKLILDLDNEKIVFHSHLHNEMYSYYNLLSL